MFESYTQYKVNRLTDKLQNWSLTVNKAALMARLIARVFDGGSCSESENEEITVVLAALYDILKQLETDIDTTT